MPKAFERKNIWKGEKIGVILMDLSNAFDKINHSLLMAKLVAYGFSRASYNLCKITYVIGSNVVL